MNESLINSRGIKLAGYLFVSFDSICPVTAWFVIIYISLQQHLKFPSYMSSAYPAFLYSHHESLVWGTETAQNNKLSSLATVSLKLQPTLKFLSVVTVKRMPAEDKRLFSGILLTSGQDCHTPLCPARQFLSILILDTELQIFLSSMATTCWWQFTNSCVRLGFFTVHLLTDNWLGVSSCCSLQIWVIWMCVEVDFPHE